VAPADLCDYPLPALLSVRIMHIAILTFEGFNELDSFIALGILNRIRKPDWRVSIGLRMRASPR
jgi:hypothetical protein